MDLDALGSTAVAARGGIAEAAEDPCTAAAGSVGLEEGAAIGGGSRESMTTAVPTVIGATTASTANAEINTFGLFHQTDPRSLDG